MMCFVQTIYVQTLIIDEQQCLDEDTSVFNEEVER